MKLLIAIEAVSLIYTIILLIVYLSKTKIKTSETRLFLAFIIVIVIGFIVEILNNLSGLLYFYTKPQLIKVTANIYLGHYVVSYSLLLMYMLFKIVKFCNKEQKANKKVNSIIVISCLLTAIGVIALIMSQEMNVVYDGTWFYGTGNRINYVIIFALIYGLANFIAIIMGFIKKAPLKECISLIIIFLIALIAGALRLFLPYFTINNTVNSLIVLVLFFEVENPDLELIGKLENSNNAKQDFLSSMSHELKTPLNIILGLSNNVGTDVNTLQNDMNNINVEALALSEIFSNIIDMNTLDSECAIEEKEYNIKDIITPLVNEYNKRLSNKGLELKCFCDAMIPKHLIGDYEKIINATRKLLSNAAKFTTAGTVTLNIGGEDQGDKYLLKIEVKDTGKGIEKSQFDKIFKEFGRSSTDVNSTTSGIGLGLTICKVLVYKMGGRILLGSEPGVGSTFIIEVPQKISVSGSADYASAETTKVESISASSTLEEVKIEDKEEPKMEFQSAPILQAPSSPAMPAPIMPPPKVETLESWGKTESPEIETLDIEAQDTKIETLESSFDEMSLDSNPIEAELDKLEENHEVDNSSLGAGKKALIVDDNALNIKVGKKIIQTFGVEVTEAGSGDECINILNEGKSFDYVFMDIMMPVKDGVETMHEIKYLDLSFEPIIIALTADAAIGSKERYLKEGFDDYISKPLTADEVARIIKTSKK